MTLWPMMLHGHTKWGEDVAHRDPELEDIKPNFWHDTLANDVASPYQVGWRCGSVGRAVDRHAANAGSIPRCVNFLCTLSYGVHTPPCANAHIYICVHIKDPVIHVRVQWIMETLKHPACTTGWVAWLCHSWLSPGKATQVSPGRNPSGTIQL